jgi:hypothetical protein
VILYLYAMGQGIDRVDDLSGAGGEPLTRLVVDGIEVIAGEVDAAPEADRASLRRQDEIVRQLHARAAALLPMRFGAAFGAEADVRRALALRQATLRARLAAVRHREQMTMRVLGAPGALGATGTTGATGATGAAGAVGAEYLRARAARAVPPAIVPLLAALKPLARETRVEPGKAHGIVATVYQLIDRGTSGEYERAVKAAGADMPELSIRVTGPAPCYAFT